jgi:hypothetical protein
MAHAGSRGTNTGNIVRDITLAAREAGLMGAAKPYKVVLDTGHTVNVFLPHESINEGIAEDAVRDWCLTADEVDEEG